MQPYKPTTWSELRRAIRGALDEDVFWSGLFDTPYKPSGRSVHLAIFVEPYLSYVMEGRKTVESRFSAVRCAPYLRVAPGDVLLLKASGGPIRGLSLVDHVWTYDLDPKTWPQVKAFEHALCATDPMFWASREGASYATLMRLSHVRPIADIPFKKRDRRGWVVLKERNELPPSLETPHEPILHSSAVPHIVTVSGRIASGKSTLAKALASSTGWTAASFGAYIRYVATQRGLGTNRATLQAIGSELVQAGEESFVTDVFRSVGWQPGQPAILEGVRHLSVLNAVRRVVAPLPVYHVHVAVGEAERSARVASRGEGDRGIQLADVHETERDARPGAALEDAADYIAYGTANPAVHAAEVIQRLSNKGQ